MNGDPAQGIPAVDSTTSTSSDNFYADTNDDGAPDLCLGRIPVRTNAQAMNVLRKMAAFESTGQHRLVFVVDDSCRGTAVDPIDFEEAFRGISDSVVHAGGQMDSFMLAQIGIGCNWNDASLAEARSRSSRPRVRRSWRLRAHS